MGGVDLKLSGQTLSVKGPLGSLERTFPEEIKVSHADESLVFQPVDESRRAKQMHGLSRTLGENMITGVAEGWSKQLKLVGVLPGGGQPEGHHSQPRLLTPRGDGDP